MTDSDLIKHLDFEKKIVCLEGKPGSGKTTLLNYLQNYDNLYCGFDLDDNDMNEQDFMNLIKKQETVILTTQWFDGLSEYIRSAVDILLKMER